MVQEKGVGKGLALVLWCLVVDYLRVSTTAAGFLGAEGNDGTWPDIEYRDQSRALWKPAAHLDRLAVLAAAYRQPQGPLCARGGGLEGIHRGLQAWFHFDEGGEAWGTGIGDPGPDPVATTVNQTLARGPVVVEGDPARPRWVLHDQSPDPVTKPVFTLTIDHGTAPSEAQYRYTVLPGAGATRSSTGATGPGRRCFGPRSLVLDLPAGNGFEGASVTGRWP